MPIFFGTKFTLISRPSRRYPAVNRPIAAWEQKGAYFMKAKTDVKAGFTVNVAKNIAIVRQRGFANYAEVNQIAVAASS
jgi:hypothetical protein